MSYENNSDRILNLDEVKINRRLYGEQRGFVLQTLDIVKETF